MKNEISSEKKLEVLHQIRSQYQRNQYDLMRRESLLYGHSAPPKHSEGAEYFPDREPDGGESLPKTCSISLKLRFALAAILVLAVIICDRRGLSLGGISSPAFFAMLEKDYRETLETWSDQLVTDIRRIE